MGIYSIRNQSIELKVKSTGAEVVEFNRQGKKFIWGGHSSWWTKSSPLLFPIVGRVPNGKYTWKNRELEILFLEMTLTNSIHKFQEVIITR